MSFALIMRDLYRNALMHFELLKEKNKYLVPSLIGGGLLIVILGLGFLYYTHMQRKEQAAQVVLAECMEEYTRAREGQAEWSTVELMCRAAYERYATTKAAALFIPFRVDALLALGQRETAISELAQMIARLSHSSPIYALFKTKLALLKLDDEKSIVQEEGLKELQTLADDTKNINRDIALYYLMSYHQMHNQPEQARASFDQLQTMQSTTPAAQSPWFTAAQDLMGEA